MAAQVRAKSALPRTHTEYRVCRYVLTDVVLCSFSTLLHLNHTTIKLSEVYPCLTLCPRGAVWRPCRLEAGEPMCL
jgi:hypothetical protein